MARSMATLLPGIVRGANSMHERSRTFSDNLQQAMRIISERSDERRKEIGAAVEQSDKTLSRIVSSSQGALSHLQFQDAVAQGLMRLDGALMDTLLTICDLAGLGPDRRSRITPPIHVEIGGDKSVDQKDAGEVLMF
jgi:flagellar hook-basal body complex protein FliE